VSDSCMVTTSFQMDYSLLMALQERARELGFRSWGHYLRHVVDYHACGAGPHGGGEGG
jgi:hypothetical protein